VKPDHRFVVHAGTGKYPLDAQLIATGLRELATELHQLR